MHTSGVDHGTHRWRRLAGCGLVALLVLGMLAVACSGGSDDDDSGGPSSTAADSNVTASPADATDGRGGDSSAPASNSADLEVDGTTPAFLGTFPMMLACQYDSARGEFILTASPTEVADQGPALLNLTLTLDGDVPPVPDGAVTGTFEFNEAQGDGRILTYRGEVDGSLSSGSEPGELYADARVDVSTPSAGDVELKLVGDCSATVFG